MIAEPGFEPDSNPLLPVRGAPLCAAYGITRREREIVAQILRGRSNREIMEDLFISMSTVKSHLYNVYQKMGIKSRGELVHAVLMFEENGKPSVRGRR